MEKGQLIAAALFMKYSPKKVLLFTPGTRLIAQLAFNVSVEVVRVFFSVLAKENDACQNNLSNSIESLNHSKAVSVFNGFSVIEISLLITFMYV